MRSLLRAPGFSTAAALTLALGIGANVGVFSLAEQTVLRTLPVPEPERLVNFVDPETNVKVRGRMSERRPVIHRMSASGAQDSVFSYPLFRDLEREQEVFVGIAAHTFSEGRVWTGERSRFETMALVSGSYFPVLGLRPTIGRLLGPDDDRADGVADSVVLSHAYWQRQFASDPDIIGSTLIVNDVPLTIVGVAPRTFDGTAVGQRASVFVPLTISFSNGGNDRASEIIAETTIPNHDRRDLYWVHLFARLNSGISTETASAAINTHFRSILSDVDAPMLVRVDEQQREAFRTRPLSLAPGDQGQTSDQILGAASNSLKFLFAAGSVLFLLCCANVAGLMLIRATTRQGELAVRSSLGATRARLTLTLFIESLVLALPAILFSVPVAWLTLAGLLEIPGVPSGAVDVGVSASALCAAVAIAFGSVLVAGLLPLRGVWRSARLSALKSYSAGQTSSRGIVRFREALLTTQVALAMALLVTMGVFTLSLVSIAQLDLGVDVESVVTFSVPPSNGVTPDINVMRRISDEVATIPGVSFAAWSSSPVLSTDGNIVQSASLEGSDEEGLQVTQNFVSTDFFRALGIGLLAGRQFNDGESLSSAIVNRRFAERLGFVPEDLIGRTFVTQSSYEIVGVVDDAITGKITNEIVPQVFRLSSEATILATGPTNFYARSERGSDQIINAINATIGRAGPAIAIMNLQSMEDQVSENIATERFAAGVSTAFAILATILSGVGLFALLTYSVAQRSREIGLRLALGATARHTSRLVMRQASGIAIIGTTLGAIAAVVIGRAAESLIVGVTAGNPVILTAAALVIASVTILSAYVPAHRASRINPVTTLRHE